MRGNRHYTAPCSLTFVKHDEGPNVRDLPLGHFAWLMLIGYPLDLSRNLSLLSKGSLWLWQISSVACWVCSFESDYESSNNAKYPIWFLLLVIPWGIGDPYCWVAHLQEDGFVLLSDEFPHPKDDVVSLTTLNTGSILWEGLKIGLGPWVLVTKILGIHIDLFTYMLVSSSTYVVTTLPRLLRLKHSKMTCYPRVHGPWVDMQTCSSLPYEFLLLFFNLFLACTPPSCVELNLGPSWWPSSSYEVRHCREAALLK